MDDSSQRAPSRKKTSPDCEDAGPENPKCAIIPQLWQRPSEINYNYWPGRPCPPSWLSRKLNAPGIPYGSCLISLCARTSDSRRCLHPSALTTPRCRLMPVRPRKKLLRPHFAAAPGSLSAVKWADSAEPTGQFVREC